jgi:hypothetical protein
MHALTIHLSLSTRKTKIHGTSGFMIFRAAQFGTCCGARIHLDCLRVKWNSAHNSGQIENIFASAPTANESGLEPF